MSTTIRTLLLILLAGELLPMSQWLTFSTIFGMGKHRLLALYAILEGAATLALAFLFAPTWGLWGICLAVGFSSARWPLLR